MACISLFGFHRVVVQCVWSMILKKGYCNIICTMYLVFCNFLEAAMVIDVLLEYVNSTLYSGGLQNYCLYVTHFKVIDSPGGDNT